MKIVAIAAAAALSLGPVVALAQEQKPVVQTQQDAGLPEAGGISQSVNLGLGGLALETVIIGGIAAVTIAGIVAVAASDDETNTSGTAN